jgi:hypothetical protein
MSDPDLTIELERMSAVDLINVLDRLYPERCISPMDTLESAHRYAGRRELIRELVFIRDHDDAMVEG